MKRISFISVLIFLVVIQLITRQVISQQKNLTEEEAGNIAIEYYQNQNNNNKQGSGENEPDAIQQFRFFTGQAAGDNFGCSVSIAGDVNGDGYSDVIVGALYNDAGGTDAGRAYIYYGGVSMDNTADVILTGAAAYDNFGISVSSAGDVNGDGYSDVIVGALYNDAGGSNAGRAYIFYGGVNMDNTADVILTGAAAYDYFGISVSGSGDVNGDGYSDVIVGAYGNDAGGSGAGRGYIYYGGAVMDNTADVILTGAAAGDYFGYSVSGSGDVNGDGYSDVIVGAYGNDAGGTNAGRGYIYYGGVNMDNTADVILTGAAAGDYFGYSVSGSGDVNGDGYSDVIVGAPYNDAGGTDAGRGYIYYGGVSMDNTADVILTGAAALDYFGWSVSSAGDVNGDGYSDVIVGAPYNDAGGTSAGRGYIYYGGVSMDNTADVILTGAAGGDNFGNSVSGSGDVNGDGYSDVIVGALYNDAGGASAGRAYLFTNSLTGTDLPDEYFSGAAAGDYFGISVSIAGDVNGDGYSDVIVGAYGNDAGGTDAGRAYIYYGGVSMDNTADVILTGAAALDYFGWSVSSAGDVNGDGYSDVIVGAPYNGAGGIEAGRAYIYYGGVNMDNTADVILTGAAAYDYFGISVSGSGDVNGDGYSDVIVGAYGNDAGGSGAGRGYIYYGGAVMDNTADVILTGAAAGDYFGYSVSGSGDVNGDGYSDVIVGAPYNDAGGTDAGRGYIYYGGVSMDNTADVILTGAAAGDYFGYSVSGSGDVNGDGYSDVIVGAPYNDAGGTSAGRGYIYYGGVSMDNTADVILTGAAANDYYGYSVSIAGDVNGDGYSDVIVGALNNDAGGINAGRGYIYYGGAVMDNTADVILTGAAVGDNFGYSVSIAGDVNGDGYSDVIVGALYNDAGGTNAGRGYIYISSSPPIKPTLFSVKDVPNDQGGQIKIQFARSGYDINGTNIITEYKVFRSSPPGSIGFVWEERVSIHPEKIPYYSFIDNTPNDSGSGSSGVYYYRVKAKTNNESVYWYSGILSGRSVDNLSPVSVKNFVANKNGASVKLSWKANTEADMKNYLIYKSYTTTLSDTATPIAAVTDTTYTDTTPLTMQMVYYFIKAQDIHNNKSVESMSNLDVYLSANIKVYLHGCYNSGTGMMNTNLITVMPLSQPYNVSPWNYSGTESVTSIPSGVVDWILVELRTDAVTVAGVRAGFLKSDGSIVDIDGVSQLKFNTLNEGNYYVVIKHRNHLGVMSSNKLYLSNISSEYNFTDNLSKSYGTNAMKEISSGVFGLYAGDGNASGTITSTDRNSVWRPQNGSNGYLMGDYNLSGGVTATDRNSYWRVNNGINTQVP